MLVGARSRPARPREQAAVPASGTGPRTMSEAQRELDRRLDAIVARLHRDPAVQAELARLDRRAAAARLAELAMLEAKADPATAALLEQAAQDAGAKPS